ncbi:hypothetical protein [Piscinibacter sp.]|jgi:soluble lytic murein transglycosylase-like protein|uniref:hypothetical protein n=1 Tax=Piscinibacter sp. TaxID=1903157 RepID=UPI003559F360
MHLIQFWLVVAIVLPVALLQWWAMRRIHRKNLAAERARRLSAQQAATKLLHQTRQQIAQLQQELAAARLAAKRPPRPALPRPTRIPTARDSLMKILDEAPQPARGLPPDGFAETMPSLQFPHASQYGSL